MSESEMAPQLIDTIGALALGLAAWIARAISSLPVPLSPKIVTEQVEGNWLTVHVLSGDSDEETVERIRDLFETLLVRLEEL